MQFKKQFDAVDLVASEAGSPFIDDIGYKVVEGYDQPVPYIKGQLNFYEMIQSSKASTDIASILARAKSDPTVLNVRQGSYGDFTNVPNTLQEAALLGDLTKEKFNNLSPEIKELFGDDYSKFYSLVVNDMFEDFLTSKLNALKQKKEKEKEVTNNE